MICGDNFTYLQTCHQFTARTRTFEATPLTWSSVDLRTSILENHQSSRSLDWASEFTAEERFLKLFEVHNFIVSRIRQISAVLNQEADLRYDIDSEIVSHNVKGSANHVKIRKHLHEHFLAPKQNIDPLIHSRTHSRIRQLQRFEGDSFLPNSPTLSRNRKVLSQRGHKSLAHGEPVHWSLRTGYHKYAVGDVLASSTDDWSEIYYLYTWVLKEPTTFVERV
jgi:hypothetical protein